MKRLGSSDSLGAMSLCPNSTDGDDQVVNSNNNTIYAREFQTMLDGFDEEGCCVDESGSNSGREKKRRLGVDQVKALEKNFEVENKLEPDRKLKLAQELGLQPRQVAVWFQNRRARWKTKQLERDYGVLKSSYDELKLNYDKLKRDNEALLKEIKELKSKQISDDRNSQVSLSPKEEEEEEEEEAIVSDTEEKSNLESAPLSNVLEEMKTEDLLCGSSILVYEFNKDGSYDSDSSAILHEDHQTNNDSSPSNLLDLHSGTITRSMNMSLQFLSSSSPSSCKESASVNDKGDHNGHILQKVYDQIEEHNFFGHEESCTNLFSDDQAPSLPWYCSEEWN